MNASHFHPDSAHGRVTNYYNLRRLLPFEHSHHLSLLISELPLFTTSRYYYTRFEEEAQRAHSDVVTALDYSAHGHFFKMSL